MCNIARNVYNRHADLFVHDIHYEEIHQSLQSYLWRESQRKRSIFMRLAYGIYAIKPSIAVQLDLFVDLPLEEKMEIEPSEAANSSIQLELFPDFK